MNQLRLAALAVLVAGGLASTQVHAAQPGAFVGAEVGNSDFDVDLDDVGSGSESDRTYAIRGGYYFTPNFAVEAFHANLFDESQDGISADVRGFGVGLVGRHNFGPDGNGFYLQGRAGLFRGKASVSVEDFGSGSESDNAPYFGVGAGYDFNANFGLGLNYTHYRSDFDGGDIDANTVTAAVEYRF